jgi:ATP-binding protein involved in chromosome partitioning
VRRDDGERITDGKENGHAKRKWKRGVSVSTIHQGDTAKQASCGHSEQIAELHSTKEHLEIQEVLLAIRHKIVVLSGKGGVGKSSVAANLSVALSLKGLQTGLLDIDLHGPSIPTLLAWRAGPSP